MSTKDLEKESSETLKHLQAQRAKANKAKKAYWQKKIDQHFGLGN